MTGRGARPVVSASAGKDGHGTAALHGVDLRGWVWIGVVLGLLTLTFDSSPIKGEGDNGGWFVLLSARAVDTALKPV